MEVVEGVGENGCEYMKGGCVVIMGLKGRNFEDGMYGGIEYVMDVDGYLKRKWKMEMVKLLKIEMEEDIKYVEGILKEFKEKKGYIIDEDLMKIWN